MIRRISIKITKKLNRMDALVHERIILKMYTFLQNKYATTSIQFEFKTVSVYETCTV